MTRRSLVALVVFVATSAVVGGACSSFDAANGSPEDAGPLEDAGALALDASATSDAGIDAASCACPGRPPCGVRIVAAGGAFCIDPYEVTESAFAEFVAATAGTTVDAGPPCSAFSVAMRSPSPPSLPARYVTFCAARAYCIWAGKSLCGRIGGGSLDYAVEALDPERSAWLKACAADGQEAVLAGTCRRGLPDDAGPSPAGSTCEGAFPGIFDMQGNVWEWIDAPVSDDAGIFHARFVGGAYNSPAEYRCAISAFPITSSEPYLGFRCCSP